jgi:hypothetical protein
MASYSVKNTKTDEIYNGNNVAELLGNIDIPHHSGTYHKASNSTKVRMMIEDGVIQQISGPAWFMGIQFGRSAQEYATLVKQEQAQITSADAAEEHNRRVIEKYAVLMNVPAAKLRAAVYAPVWQEIKFSSPRNQELFNRLNKELK